MTRLPGDIMTGSDNDDRWKSDWRAFIEEVDRLYIELGDDRLVTQRFANQSARWQGDLRDKCSDPVIRGVDLRMEAVPIQSPGNDGIPVDFLVLGMDEDEFSKWDAIPIGSMVRFETTISDGNALFAGIFHCAGTFQFATKDSRLLNVISTPDV